MAKRIGHVIYLKIFSAGASLKSGRLDNLNYPKSRLMASIAIKASFIFKNRGH
jgi:hypothetical protein